VSATDHEEGDLRPWSCGVYSHFVSDEGAAGVEAAYGDRLKRLTALKDTYDPANLFRLNANIPPTALATAEGQDRVR
jgi:hypothetical protein